MVPMYKVVVVDDEPGALSIIKQMVNNIEGYEVVAEFSDAKGLPDKIISLKPHVLFLDIHLGEISGVDIARQLYDMHCETRIVFVSAYDKYAIQAFEYNIIDYILKPVSRDRLEKCLKKVESSFSGKPMPEENPEKPRESSSVRFNTQSGFLLVDPKEVVFLEADHVYTKIVMSRQSSHYVAQNIGKILTALNNENFLRISRSYAVNATYLREVNRTQRKCLLFDGKNEFELSITKTGMQQLDEFFG
ncbi:MAG: LytR/AlgR family response regulator transcription factor [Marinilabiliaceae bacterium]